MDLNRLIHTAIKTHTTPEHATTQARVENVDFPKFVAYSTSKSPWE